LLKKRRDAVDRVNHDRLLAKIAERVSDRRLLKLISLRR
jgi:retron-type reverse transcriptase